MPFDEIETEEPEPVGILLLENEFSFVSAMEKTKKLRAWIIMLWEKTACKGQKKKNA